MNPFLQIDVFAVLVATIVSMSVGAVWFSPNMFGNKWMKLVGLSREQAAASANRALGVGFVACLMSTYFAAVLLILAAPATLLDALLLGLIIWLAGMFPVSLHRKAWEDSSWDLVHINSSSSLLTMMVAVAILYSWPW